MTEYTVVPRIRIDGILLEPRAGGIRLKVRGAPEIYLPWASAAALAHEIDNLARAAAKTRA